MYITQYIKSFLFLIILLITIKGFSQLSKTHYIPPLTFADASSSSPQDQYIYLSTPRTSDVPYTIKPIGQPEANYITGVVSNNNPEEIFIGSGGNTQLYIPSPSSSVISRNKGYIIESEDVIYVSVRMNAGGGFQAGALVSKGISAPDTIFRIGSYTNENPQDNYLNFVSVMATEDNTQVNFSNLPSGIVVQNYNGPIPVNVTLNEGESYTLAINSNDTPLNRDGLIGCLVNSDKPVVVNCGSANGSFSDGNARDYGIDQIVGLSKIGTEYIFVRGDGNNDWENVLLVAHTNNTSIRVNGNATGISINAGEYFVIEGNNYSGNGNMYVETSQPVFAYQGVGGLGDSGNPSEANQGMFFVPPLSCETRGNLDNIANINNIGPSAYEGGITIVTKTTANVTVTSSTTGNINLGAPNLVTGNINYITYKIKGINGNITVESNDELYCAYFNYTGAATSGSFYSGFPSPPEINFDAEFITLGNCIPNVTLEAANPQVFDSFRWQSDEGFGFQDIPGQTQFNFKPTTPSTYRLVGIITCTGEELISTEIPVSICPDDRDNDGIIDNIDIDNDNDGILNCTESQGDVILDLSDTRPPILRFQDGSSNTTISTNTTTINRTEPNNSILRLTGTGTIISEIDQANNADNNYTIEFAEAVNVKFSEDIGTTHTNVDGEFFIASILPLNKNITLLDPDNRLLVDSNFDGIFETGVTIFSGSEIRFKFNPSPNGTTPYTFLANQVDGFSFDHVVENTTAPSTFSGNISLTCFTRDTDFDGIKDEFDLDSDNDGIPDFIENTGIFVALSGIDNNGDGLDDIYDASVMPIDTDGDTVVDFYDLDSDNDGITDLIETGELGLLSDTDLNGIVDGPNFGSNGWIDAAETTPDSNMIGYTLNDLDTDGVYSYIDEDSDGDSCTDVIEAGFSDANMDTYLGDAAVVVDVVADATTGQGLVTNATDGYTIPDANYLTAAPITITLQPENLTACEASTDSFTIVSSEAEFFQWEISTNGGTTWAIIVDDATYSGSQTDELVITNIQLTFNNYQYRVKLDRDGNSCGIFSDAALLEVNPLPMANTPSIYQQCDDDSNDGQSFFNLTLDEIKTEINPNFVTENLIFTYFETEPEANSNTNPIATPEAYQDALGFTPETVWIRVEDANGCHSVIPLELEVNPSSAALSVYNPQSIFQCDDGTNNRDGISTFDLNTIRNDIETNVFNTVTVTAHFYESIIDAELETNEILDIANHENNNSQNIQTLWIRVKSNLGNNCLGVKELTDVLNVETLPTANPVTFDSACDSDTSDSVLNFPFDTSQLESDILNGQNPSEVSITYFTENGDPLLYNDGTQVTSPIDPVFLTENQNIIVRVTNNNTQDPDGACFDETTINFTVDEQPVIANSIPQQIECDGNAGDIDDDGFFPFPTTSFTTTILGSQTGMGIIYNYRDENGNNVSSNTLPNPLNSGNQTITVEVFNTINSSCSVTTTIDFIVNPLPEFEVESPRIVCTFNPTFSIDLEPIESNSGETYTYEWNFEGSVISTNAVLENVSAPGTYTITLTKTDGTGCSRTRDIAVNSSEAANITLEDITINDISQNNTVSIDTANIGRGTYEYALVEEGSNFIDYQTEPIFTNVRAGFYTLFIREEICGEIEIPFSVIGSRRFFTPNGDGVNDFWQIQGISNNIQPNSLIYIFDRYGKLLKQLSPSSRGWDGTFNGQLMPTEDYWFKVNLQDGRTFMGHFTLKR
ncbi:T9SS type B sorting domain-containing protein [uncultured Algibacter sp.]|uniref:T9SS type B sorting domain-containing protein n=1 Tax=uncultured Algibacter sp. TaxID=298659 RepID=UPI00260A3919|nr:T9SS type B sorting domain-containing protein [uncultured Algibacter sp.]